MYVDPKNNIHETVQSDDEETPVDLEKIQTSKDIPEKNETNVIINSTSNEEK